MVFFEVVRGEVIMANTREPILHPVPIQSLRPTQMTVGMREVKEKRERWREHKSKKKQAELLGKHMARQTAEVAEGSQL